ncbi:MAG: hypothetical protein ABI947_28470 [Chloroflexota bacterium]
MNKNYTYKELLETYLKLPQVSGIHPDFQDYYSGLLMTLEILFDVKVDIGRPGSRSGRDWTLAVVYDNLIKRIRAGYVSGSWMEGGPYVTLFDMAEQNPERKIALQVFNNVIEQERHLRQSYYELLYQLFDIFFGKTDLRFTSEDLLRVGFDDSKEPDIKDYDDYL